MDFTLRSRLLLTLALTFAVTFSNARADDEGPIVDPDAGGPPGALPPKVDTTLRINKNQDRYWHLGIGLPIIGYDADTEGVLQYMREKGDGYSRLYVNLEASIYWPREDKQTLIGLGVTSVIDSISSEDINVKTMQVLIAFSWQKYFFHRIGHGFYGRFDLGPAFVVADVDVPKTTKGFEPGSFGVGLEPGVGYAVPVRPDLRYTISINYLWLKPFASERIRTGTLRVGLMF